MKQEPESYFQGYILAMESSKSLLKIADQSAILNEYGIACSLSILATEEAIKACFCLHKHHVPEMKLDKNLFYKHGIKHEQIKNHLYAFVYLLTKSQRIFDKQNSEENLTFCSFLINLLNGKDEEYLVPGDLKSKEILDWHTNANRNKNDGLYVGIQDDGSWHNPRNLSQQQYQDERRFSSKMILLSEQFDQFHILWKSSAAKLNRLK